jgi:dTDP-4-dehydrorhamnose 3,5-epimerase-like enzyme
MEIQMSDKKVPVLITTDKDKRGVFFGYVNENDMGKDEIYVTDVQMCVYWSKEVKGVLGLAAGGPDKNCKITAPTKAAIIKGVTFVAECSEDAIKNWKKQPWG